MAIKILLYPFLSFKKNLKSYKIYCQDLSNINNKYKKPGVLSLGS